MNLYVDEQGVVQAVWTDALLPLVGALGGQARIERASSVEPDGTLGGLGWGVQLAGQEQPVQGFSSRAEALAWEVEEVERGLAGHGGGGGEAQADRPGGGG